MILHTLHSLALNDPSFRKHSGLLILPYKISLIVFSKSILCGDEYTKVFYRSQGRQNPRRQLEVINCVTLQRNSIGASRTVQEKKAIIPTLP